MNALPTASEPSRIDVQLAEAVRHATRSAYNRTFLVAIPISIVIALVIGRSAQERIVLSIGLLPVSYAVLVTIAAWTFAIRLQRVSSSVAWYATSVAGPIDAMIRSGDLAAAVVALGASDPSPFERGRLSALMALARGGDPDLASLAMIGATSEDPDRAAAILSVLRSLVALPDTNRCLAELESAYPWATDHIAPSVAGSVRHDLIKRRFIALVGYSAISLMTVWFGLSLPPNIFGPRVDPALVGAAAWTNSSMVVNGQRRTWAPDMETARDTAIPILVDSLATATRYTGGQPDVNSSPVFQWIPGTDVPSLPSGAPSARIDVAWIYFKAYFDSGVAIVGIRYHGELSQRYYLIDSGAMQRLADLLYPVAPSASG